MVLTWNKIIALANVVLLYPIFELYICSMIFAKSVTGSYLGSPGMT
jgi:hypothetical protein